MHNFSENSKSAMQRFEEPHAPLLHITISSQKCLSKTSPITR